MTTVDDVFELLEEPVAARGLELIDVERPGGTLRVTVDRPGGVDLDTIGDLTREVSLLLDERQLISGRYTLEISSPGVERTLRRPAHYERAVGERVAIKTRAEVDGARRFEGVVVAAGPGEVVVSTDDGERTFPYDEIRSARTVFEWGPAPKPGSRSQQGSKSTKAKTTKKATAG